MNPSIHPCSRMLLSVWALISDVMEAMDEVSSKLCLLEGATSDGSPARTAASELLDMLESDELEDCRNIL